jgi:hypothetical protein
MTETQPPDAPLPEDPVGEGRPVPPDSPGEPAPPQPASPEKKRIDLRQTPSGQRPSAWKSLPPPEIIRAKPKKEDPAEKAKELLQSKGAKQAGIALGGVLLLALLVFALMPRTTDRTPLGAAEIFAEALEEHDAEGMRAVSTGIAPSLVEGLLLTIDRMVEEAEASEFENARPVVPPIPLNATSATGTIICEGVNGDDFLRIDIQLDQNEEEAWRVSMFVSTSLRP